jgi:alpha-tubulin suppressor-like RCC1 family protein
MGNNEFYQSGNGNNEKLKSIYKLEYFENMNLKIQKIVCGDGFNVFLTGINLTWFKFLFLILKINLECGKLFSVGFNGCGCIGDGTCDDCSIIKQIDYFSNIFIVDVVCGSHHCLANSKKGEIFAWGDSEYGKIGNGKSGKDEIQLTPIKIFKIWKNLK